MNIITATIADAEFLTEFGTKTFYESFAAMNTEENMQSYISKAFALEQIHSELKNANSKWFICELDGIRVGYMKMNFGDAQTETKGDYSAEVERIYVDKDYQELKLGKLLIEKAFEVAKQANCRYIWLGVWEHNLNAIGFYKHLGFESESYHSFLLGTELQTDLILRKDF